MIGKCRVGTNRGVRTRDVSPPWLAGQEVAPARMEPVMNTLVGSHVYTVLLEGRSERLGAKARRWWRLKRALSGPYYPERHYMRGPGPKWRAKHAAKRPER
jgi:hypothetical protein